MYFMLISLQLIIVSYPASDIQLAATRGIITRKGTRIETYHVPFLGGGVKLVWIFRTSMGATEPQEAFFIRSLRDPPTRCSSHCDSVSRFSRWVSGTVFRGLATVKPGLRRGDPIGER